MKKTAIALSLLIGTLASTSSNSMPPGNSYTAEAERIIERSGELAKVDTLKLCIDFYDLKTEEERQAYFKELDLRSQLSEQDHVLVPQHKVSNSMTMCGMYMSKGKPLAEKSRQMRPLTFKTVHVYEDLYITTQSGMITAIHERKEGEMPPALSIEMPKVQPSPTVPN